MTSHRLNQLIALQSCSILLSLQISFAIALQYEAPPPLSGIQINQYLNNLIVEEPEIMRVPLYQYFSGQLLQYEIKVFLNGSDITQSVLDKKLVYISEPVTITNSTPFNQLPQESHIEPFLRSSAYFQNENGSFTYFLDRNFIFHKIDHSYSGSGLVSNVYAVPLDTDLINQECSDLNFWYNFFGEMESLLMLCKGRKQTEVDGVIAINSESDFFMVQIKDDKDTGYPGIKYMKLLEDPGIVVTQFSGFQAFNSIQNQNQSSSLVFFLSNINSTKLFPSISFQHYQFGMMSFNTSLFDQIDFNQSYTVTPLDSPPFNLQCLMKFPVGAGSFRQVQDFTIISQLDLIVAILFPDWGILIANFQEHSHSQCTVGVINQMLYMGNIQSLYYSTQMEKYLYATLINPPGVVEINIDNPNNAYVKKLYSINSDGNRYSGLNVMAVNLNYVIHSLYDSNTMSQVLRVYNRNSTRNSILMYQYPLPLKSRSNFYIFPNIFMDAIIFRDELNVNLTLFSFSQLVISTPQFEQYRMANPSFAEYPSIRINLTVTDFYSNQFSTSFTALVVNNTNTTVFTVNDTLPLEIFYDCGNKFFYYELVNQFSGPNYRAKVEKNQCINGDCKFEFDEEYFIESFESTLINYTNCQTSYTINAISDVFSDLGSMIQICINYEHSTLISFQIDQNQIDFTVLNTIKLPKIQIVDSAIDYEQRILILLTDTPQVWFQNKYDLQIFYIGQLLVYMKEVTCDISSQLFGTIFSYNSQINRGLIFGINTDQSDTYLLQYFSLVQYAYTVLHQSSIGFDPNFIAIQAQISDTGFVFILFENSTLQILQLIPNKLVNSILKPVIKNMNLTEYGISHSFDLTETYFILYADSRNIIVFDIFNYFYLQFKMVLPLYSAYNQYQFYALQQTLEGSMESRKRLQSIQSQVVRALNGHKLVILLYDNNQTGLSGNQSCLLIYDLEQSQHNSFYIGQNISDMTNGTFYTHLKLTKMAGMLMVSVINDRMLMYYTINDKNLLYVNQSFFSEKKLLNLCSNESQNPLVASPLLLVETLNVSAISMFLDNDYVGNSDEDLIQASIAINIYSQNQGFVIKPTVSEKVNITYDSLYDAVSGQNLILENFLEGYNISFGFACEYQDSNQSFIDCGGALTAETLSYPHSYLLVFVTSKRQVLRSFQVGQFFIMFDSQNYMDILALDLSQQTYQNAPLKFLAQLDNSVALKCILNQFIDVMLVNSSDTTTNIIVAYQCMYFGKEEIKLSLVQITTETKKSRGSLCKFQFDGYFYNVYVYTIYGGIINGSKVLDFALYINKNTKDIRQLNTTIILSQYNPYSYSNIVTIYQLILNFSSGESLLFYQDQLSAQSLNKNMFYPNCISIIPNTSWAVITDVGNGFLLYDLNSFIVVQDIEFQALDQFYEQDMQTLGPLKVYNTIVNWPFSIQSVTNYGIFIFEYNKTLNSTGRYMDEYEVNYLQPLNYYIIRFHQDEYNYQMASNAWGYAFLLRKQVSKSDFEFYLGAVSYYSNELSKFNKLMYITNNVECISLNVYQSPSTTQSENELYVTFVCGTYLYIIDLCMRPHLLVNMSLIQNPNMNNEPVNHTLMEGVMGYNQYSIQIMGDNQLTTSVVFVNLGFSLLPSKQFRLQMTLFLLGIFLVLFLVLYIQFRHNLTTPEIIQQKRGEQKGMSPCKVRRVNWGDSNCETVRRTSLSETMNDDSVMRISTGGAL